MVSKAFLLSFQPKSRDHSDTSMYRKDDLHDQNDLQPHGSTENQFINQLKQHFDQLFLSLDNLRELLFAQIEKTVRKYNANGHKMSNMHSLSRRYLGFASASLNADTLWSPQYLP